MILIFFSLALIIPNLSFNGIFVDEEHYISVGKYLLSGNMESVVGNPLKDMFGFYIAPIFLYIGDLFGGLILSRFLNSIFAIGFCLMVYLITKEIYGSTKTASIAFLLSIFFPPVFFIARFATLDASSLFFTASALFVAMKAEKESSVKKTAALMLFSASLLYIGFLCKYIAIIGFLAIFLIIVRRGWISVHFILPFFFLIADYVFRFSQELGVLFFSQLKPQTGLSFDVFFLLIIMLVPYMILSFFSLKDKKYIKIFAVGLFSFVLFQILVTNFLNGFKQAAFAFIFIIPFAANGLEKIIFRNYHWNNLINDRILIARIFLGVFSVLFIISYFLTSNYLSGNFYINEEKTSKILDGIVSPSDYVLVEGSAYRYYTKKLEYSHVVTNFWFDFNGDKIVEESDYKEAIKSGYFKAIMTLDIKSRFNIDSYLKDSPYSLFYEERHNLSYGEAYLRIYVFNRSMT